MSYLCFIFLTLGLKLSILWFNFLTPWSIVRSLDTVLSVALDRTFIMNSGKDELVGQSVAMRDVRRLIETAPAKTTVLVLGEPDR